MDPSGPLGTSRSCVGKCREEGKYVAVGSTGRRGGKQDLVNLQCQTREFQFDPFIHGEVPLEQWRRDILERLDYGSGR